MVCSWDAYDHLMIQRAARSTRNSLSQALENNGGPFNRVNLNPNDRLHCIDSYCCRDIRSAKLEFHNTKNYKKLQ